MNSSFRIILASNSPRRKALLKAIGLNFSTITISCEENYPDNLPISKIATFLAEKKAEHADPQLIDQSTILITADTIVVAKGKVLGKPENRGEAMEMLQLLSGCAHQVFTGVCIVFKGEKILLSDVTTVYFRQLTSGEMTYYTDHYKPFDKAGAYGIQEWIGMIGIEKIEGTYFNVMGLPVNKVYDVLRKNGVFEAF